MQTQTIQAKRILCDLVKLQTFFQISIMKICGEQNLFPQCLKFQQNGMVFLNISST
jgi:hypothetical protein